MRKLPRKKVIRNNSYSKIPFTFFNNSDAQTAYGRFLATGESYRSLAFQFRISHSWISTIIREVLVAICNRLKNIALPEPTENSLIKVSEDFYEIWNFPNCCGAVDGKHIRIVCPDNSGTLYFNYKSFFSVVLLVLVDAHNEFLVVDIGSYGKEGDSGIFPKSNLGKSISTGEFKFSKPK
ncbi:protein ANTAGONIST OF LIKE HETEROCHROMATIN PROTEIN 1-like [Aphis craccivora]|uniref:Protein ANTAGONIST OF LIKE HETEROCHROMATIN PROTEIN 1-like n=1 Tax=Aphis craccivora TaxID=307492 RepID=A0A6G0VMU0_APHCR|nr:protein ANTAGONIST OF LIKE HETEROCHROMATIN PROTEIN 1-like [Aphis craccivora]